MATGRSNDQVSRIFLHLSQDSEIMVPGKTDMKVFVVADNETVFGL
jgi:hypothetical protein